MVWHDLTLGPSSSFLKNLATGSGDEIIDTGVFIPYKEWKTSFERNSGRA
jgi:hypothetical protein